MALELNIAKTGAVLVVGGSGGVGSAICRAFAEAGSAVALTYLHGEERARAVCESLVTGSSMHRLDARDYAAVEALVAEVAASHGGIHTLVSASGPRLRFQPIATLEVERWRENIDTDVHGVFNLVRASLPFLRQTAGSVVALSTMAVHRILPRDAVSACPKAAVETLIRQLAREEGAHGVRANVVALGGIDAGMGSVGTDSSIVEEIGEEGVAAILASIPLGARLGSAEDIAAAVAFLASAQAAYITGQTLLVDGGATL